MEDFQSQFKTETDQIQFYPFDKKEAEFIYIQLKVEWSYLREKLNKSRDSLDKLLDKDIEKKTQEVGTLIFVNKALVSIKDKFEAVKIWFDKNDLPHPKVPKITKLREERVALFNKYITNLRQKIKDDIMPNQSDIQGT
ncbi:MAG TPA: hypothetical protein EYN82_03720 [Candidatus Marinimicrobia bacterium]|nr:hypothetical protein [Candidatus Neomarinimicrobiota bacterium]HIB29415.1 hypothetical protein [Candidatus Neomarinimicrobiota bacterium]HIB52414.1 hypothetical protein [Candidatus Neomarinimicrobiota bacterium]HIN96847.1 hypothetical protein [Candidatus Neomarinimicrobiota bacterium]HIO40793.1 hypothetical protein [Candidatus Neomarinimicrobiota bacterium]